MRDESIIPLAEVGNHLGLLSGQRRPHLVTYYRWTSKGVRGRQLESIHIGGRKYTSVEAVERFVRALGDPSTADTPRRQTARRQAGIAKANRELEALGV